MNNNCQYTDEEIKQLQERLKVFEEALIRISGMSEGRWMCKCGRPTGIAAIKSCADQALEDK